MLPVDMNLAPAQTQQAQSNSSHRMHELHNTVWLCPLHLVLCYTAYFITLAESNYLSLTLLLHRISGRSFNVQLWCTETVLAWLSGVAVSSVRPRPIWKAPTLTNHSSTNQLYGSALLQQLTAPQTIQNVPASCGIRMFITWLTRTNLIHFTITFTLLKLKASTCDARNILRLWVLTLSHTHTAGSRSEPPMSLLLVLAFCQ
jgi:hypothetical protein